MTLKYTFLLPAYKACFFEEALLSIKSQTFQDFRCIVSDDCSPENLKLIYDKVCSDDTRFTYRRNENNIGGKNLVQHWNMLVDMCDTEYLIMASDDDIYYPNYLEEVNKLTIKYPQVDLIRGRLQRIDEKDEILIKGGTTDELMDQVHFVYFYFHDIHGLQNHCYKTSALKSMGGFVYYPQAWYSDDATNIIMAANGCASTQKIVFGFRTSEIQISSTISQKIIEDKIDATIAYDKWLKHYCKKVIFEGLYIEESICNTIIANHKERTRAMLNDLLIELKILAFFRRLIEVSNKKIITFWVVVYRFLLHKLGRL